MKDSLNLVVFKLISLGLKLKKAGRLWKEDFRKIENKKANQLRVKKVKVRFKKFRKILGDNL